MINGVAVARSVPLRGLQKTVAERMVESQRTMASVTAMAEADAAPLLALLRRLRNEVSELSLTHLLIKATALCLRRHPRLNATLADGTIHELAEVNISVALSLPSDDLQIAVVRDADEKPLLRIAEELGSLQERAAAGKLKPGDVRGGDLHVEQLRDAPQHHLGDADQHARAGRGAGRRARRASSHAGRVRDWLGGAPCPTLGFDLRPSRR